MQQQFKLSLAVLNTITLIVLMVLATPLPASAAPLSQAGCGWYYPETLAMTREANPYADIPFSDVAIYMPPHTKGDQDFSGNGPQVVADVAVNISSWGLYVNMGLIATETKHDWTTVSGRGESWFLHLRPEWKLRRVAKVKPDFGRLAVIPQSIITVAESPGGGWWGEAWAYKDEDHEVDIHMPKGRPAQVLQRLEAVGDTRGDEAGTRTLIRAYTSLLAYELCPRN